METEKIKVSYRDKSANPPKNVHLGDIDVPRFGNTAEAVAYFETEEAGKGEELCLSYIHAAYDIEQQRIFRDANRPDREKTVSMTAKFKQLSPEKQEEILRQAGLL